MGYKDLMTDASVALAENDSPSLKSTNVLAAVKSMFRSEAFLVCGANMKTGAGGAGTIGVLLNDKLVVLMTLSVGAGGGTALTGAAGSGTVDVDLGGGLANGGREFVFAMGLLAERGDISAHDICAENMFETYAANAATPLSIANTVRFFSSTGKVTLAVAVDDDTSVINPS
tara:strand:+ start:157 stop:672 length:516 start_codon:yes stop_codon:yes gene_type:complete